MLKLAETPSTAVPPPPPPGGEADARARSNRTQPARSLNLAVFFAIILWFRYARLLAQNASGEIAAHLNLSDFQPLLGGILLLLLVAGGVLVLRGMDRRGEPLRVALGLPARPTSRTEWATGAAIGWGLAVASVLPMALGKSLSVQFWTEPRAFFLVGLTAITLAIATLAHSLAIYGYGFKRLIEAAGPVRATLILLALVAIQAGLTQSPPGTPDGPRILIAMLACLLLSLCWIRTHGLWLLWGLHFAWAASTALIFGLPLPENSAFASVVNTRAIGPAWLTGGDYGPAAAAFSVLILVAAIPVLVRVTDDYAWNYTRRPIIAAGYEVNVPPPAAHAAMETASAPRQPSLVQILPVAPKSADPPEYGE